MTAPEGSLAKICDNDMANGSKELWPTLDEDSHMLHDS